MLELAIKVEKDVKVAIITMLDEYLGKKRQEISAEKQTIIFKKRKFRNWKIQIKLNGLA